MDRYRVTATRDGRKIGILDRVSYDYCGLPDEDGTVKPLEWQTRAAAEAWLQTCYRTWQAWEGKGWPTPKDWRPHPPATSPWDKGVSFYN
jgi:hypothetical protein